MTDWEDIAKQLAYLCYRIGEGDDVEIFETLKSYGFLDESYEWIYEEDEE